jgi:tetratricopeptide (TPR) repeat protein
VDVLLEGEVLRSVDRVRITLRMREGSTARVLWSATRQRTPREVLALQAEMAGAVASATNITVAGLVRDRLSTVRAVDPDVYEAYLKGRYHWNQRTEGSLQRALQFYQQAVDLDPTYAPAHVGIADCYNQFGTLMVGTDSPRRFRPAATAAAIKALQIDPNMAEAHATLGYVKHYEWDWTGAERELKRAIELNPSSALARVWYANVLMSRRRFEDALREVILARELDPLSLAVNTNAGWVLSAAGHHEEAVKQLQKTLELDPNYVQAHWRLALARANLGQFREAIREAETVVRLTDRAPSSLAMLARISVLTRQNDRARRLVDELRATAKLRYVSPGAIASVYVLLNEKEAAFMWLQRAYEERSNYLAFLAVEEYPVPDEIRSDPRFENLLRRTGLLANE